MEESHSLFRKEAVEAKNIQLMGKVLIHQPLGYSISALIAAAFVMLVLLFAYFGTYTRKATVPGILIPEQGMLRLNSPSAGLILSIHVSEGQIVEKGEVLFVISGERLSEAGGTQMRIGEQLEQRLLLLERNEEIIRDRFRIQIDAFDKRLTNISQELLRFRDEQALLERRKNLADAHLKRQLELEKLGFISLAQLQIAEAELLTLQGQQASLRRTHDSLEREQTDLKSQRKELELRQREEAAQIAGEIARAKQEQLENNARSEQMVVAPFAGVVTGLNIQVGQQIPAGILLASLIPEGAMLTAQLYAAPQQAGFIEAGQTVLMRYSAYPYQKFGMARGQVVEISKSPYTPQELPPHIANTVQGKGGTADLFYRVTVKLYTQKIEIYGKQHNLKTGMLLDADIIQDKRRLYEWALDPIYAVTGRLTE